MTDQAGHDNTFSGSSKIGVEVAIAVATAPLLAALVGARLTATALHGLGQWSEEIFRGDRLPSLNTRTDAAAPPNSPSIE